MSRSSDRPARRGPRARKSDHESTKTPLTPNADYQRPVRLIIADAANAYLTSTAGAGRPFAADELADHVCERLGTEPNLLSKLAHDCARYRKEIEEVKARLRTMARVVSINNNATPNERMKMIHNTVDALLNDVRITVALETKEVARTSVYHKLAFQLVVLMPKPL